jgi:acetolactate synthase-1/2/3 large subunit
MVARGGNASVQSLQLAIKHACAGPGGSVAVLFPLEALRGRVAPDTAPALYTAASYATPPPAMADEASVHRVAALLAGAAAPVIVAGGGVYRASAHDALRALAERIGAAVVTTAGAKGAIAETHPLALGVFGTFGTAAANRATAAADVVLVVGSRLSPSDTANENPALLDPARQRIVSVDIEPRNAGWTLPAAEVLCGDAGVVLDQLTTALGERDDPGGVERVAAIRAEEGYLAVPEPPAGDEPLSPRWVVHELSALLPDDVIVCGDAGENRIFLTHHFQTRTAGSFVQPAGVGAMGYALPAALAAKLVMPHRPVVAVCGDGGFAMAMNGLLTALEEAIPIVVIVLNNSALGWVLHGQGDRPFASRFGEVDYSAVAAAMGAYAVRVRTADELRAAVPAALAAGRAAVVEVVVSEAATFRDVTSPLA